MISRAVLSFSLSLLFVSGALAGAEFLATAKDDGQWVYIDTADIPSALLHVNHEAIFKKYAGGYNLLVSRLPWLYGLGYRLSDQPMRPELAWQEKLRMAWERWAARRLSEYILSRRPALVVATPGAEPQAVGGYAAALLLDGWMLLGRPSLRAAEEAFLRSAAQDPQNAKARQNLERLRRAATAPGAATDR